MKNLYRSLEKIPIQLRLSLGHAIWMALIFIGIGIGVSRAVEDSILKTLDATLLTSAKTIRDAQLSHNRKLSAFHDPLYWDGVEDDLMGDQRYIRAYAQLVDTSGKVKARTSNIRVNLPVTPLALSRAEAGLETFEYFRISGGGTLRQLTLPVTRSGRFAGELIQVGSTMSSSMSTINSVRSMLWISLSLGLVISVFFGYILINWSLKPVSRMTHEVSKLGFADGLEKRIKLPPADDDLRLLAKTFNEMLSRIEEGFSKLRRFSGDVSHELRTPLAVLRGEAELALRKERTSEQYQESLKTIVRESSLMSEIVEELLLFARAQGRAISIEWHEIPLELFMVDVIAMVKSDFEKRSITLEVEYGGCEQTLIRVGGSYLALALKNLLLNACKFSSHGQTVICRISETEESISISVQDFGEGISEEALPFIFDLFYRADTARNRSNGGVGIGLSLAKALVALHDGSIDVRSITGSGATFTIKVPKKMEKGIDKESANGRLSLRGLSFSKTKSIKTRTNAIRRLVMNSIRKRSLPKE